jgi:hypothetical protein
MDRRKRRPGQLLGEIKTGVSHGQDGSTKDKSKAVSVRGSVVPLEIQKCRWDPVRSLAMFWTEALAWIPAEEEAWCGRHGKHVQRNPCSCESEQAYQECEIEAQLWWRQTHPPMRLLSPPKAQLTLTFLPSIAVTHHNAKLNTQFPNNWKLLNSSYRFTIPYATTLVVQNFLTIRKVIGCNTPTGVKGTISFCSRMYKCSKYYKGRL